jgi:intracellular septation protein
MSQAISVPAPIWLKLNWAWTLFFAATGVVNLYVAYNFSESTWVNFKLFGMVGLTLVFDFIQAFYLSRYIESDDGKE